MSFLLAFLQYSLSCNVASDYGFLEGRLSEESTLQQADELFLSHIQEISAYIFGMLTETGGTSYLSRSQRKPGRETHLPESSYYGVLYLGEMLPAL